METKHAIIEELYNKHRDDLIREVLGIVGYRGTHADPEDIVQQAFVGLLSREEQEVNYETLKTGVKKLAWRVRGNHRDGEDAGDKAWPLILENPKNQPVSPRPRPDKDISEPFNEDNY